MHAAYIDRLGPAEEIRFAAFPAPVPGGTEVLVDTLATTVNPVDTFVRSGAFSTRLPSPFVVGRDLVGTVAEGGATGFRRGELVWSNSMGHEGRQGAAAEQVAVPADRLYRLPAGVDPITAVAVAHPAGTAYLALFTHGELRAGHTVLVCGGGGNVGGAAIALAVGAGARVIATASEQDAPYCRSLGAAEVLDYRDPELTEQIRKAAPDGIDLHVNTSGHHDLEQACAVLAPGGRIVLLAGLGARPVLPVGPLFTNDASIRGFVISHATTEQLARAAEAINRMLAAGTLLPRRVEEQPLSAIAEAHRRMEAGELHGSRVVLRADRT